MLYELFTIEKHTRLEEIEVFVSSSGLDKLITIYESDEVKGIDIISSFLACIKIYAGCMIRFEIATDLLNLIESKNPRLCNINIFNELYSLYHCDAYQTYGVVDVSNLGCRFDYIRTLARLRSSCLTCSIDI